MSFNVNRKELVFTIISLVTIAVSAVPVVTIEEVQKFIDTYSRQCFSKAFHVRPLDHNPNNFTYLLQDTHWTHDFPVADTTANFYNGYDITCTTDVGSQNPRW
jgi:hypothetical protein